MSRTVQQFGEIIGDDDSLYVFERTIVMMGRTTSQLPGRPGIMFFFFFFTHIYSPATEQAVVTGVVPSSPRFLPSIFIAHRVQQSHCSSFLHRVSLTHALALSASQFVNKKKSSRIFTSMHSGGFDLTKLTCTRLEDDLVRHRATAESLRITSGQLCAVA